MDYSYFGQLAKKKGGITLTTHNYLKLTFFFLYYANSGNQKI